MNDNIKIIQDPDQINERIKEKELALYQIEQKINIGAILGGSLLILASMI